MRPCAKEEIYVSLVVVKRLAQEGQEPLDPAHWAHAVMETLRADGDEHHVYALSRVDQPPRTGSRRVLAPLPFKSISPRPRRSVLTTWTPTVCLFIGVLSLITAAYLGFHLVR